MGRKVKPLTNTEVRYSKPKGNFYNVSDGYGLVTYAISNIVSQTFEFSITSTNDSALKPF